MKLRQLEIALEDVQGFEFPKIELEQYVTTPHLAACLLHMADFQFGDINDKCVVDLGCGSGILSIGASILGANYCVGIDIDSDALNIFQENSNRYDVHSTMDWLQASIDRNFTGRNGLLSKSFDTVVMNPPFGTKRNKGADMAFLQAASGLATTAVYSLHKSSTREHVLKKAADFGLKAHILAELIYNLDASYKFHKKKSKDIAVDFIRFTFA